MELLACTQDGSASYRGVRYDIPIERLIDWWYWDEFSQNKWRFDWPEQGYYDVEARNGLESL
jgi:hypothetical protein